MFIYSIGLANRERVWCLMTLSSSLLVEAIFFITVYHFFGARISKRMDLEGAVNCTNLLNVFLEVVNDLNFGEFYPS